MRDGDPQRDRDPQQDGDPQRGDGLRAGLAQRHLTMLALGGVIGAGLFVGSGQGLAAAGPAVLISFLLAAALALGIMKMLGTLAIREPVSGAFSVYAERALGRWAGVMTGWMYAVITAAAIAVESLAAAGIVHGMLPCIPLTLAAAVLLSVMVGVNLASVKSFGEAEFWFAALKVSAVVVFIAIGVVALAGRLPGHPEPGPSALSGHGGLLPNGPISILTGLLTVVFAFGGMEVIAMAAAESAEPGRAIARAVRSAIWRIALFYLGSGAVVVALLPWTAARPGVSPYAQVLDRLGIPGAGRVTETVVLIALLSALNANLYGTSRMVHSLARRGDAPGALARTSRSGTPRRAVLASAVVGYGSVAATAVWPGAVLDLLARTMGGTMLFMWLAITVSYLVLHRRALGRVSPLAVSCALAIVVIVVTMYLQDSTRGQVLSAAAVAVVPALAGWIRQRRGAG
ncbi:amino acid permease [Streptomyces sp. AC602_WCS936]|uniref:amino acid permease n=1 Tax=Streptomyces sp. AC602_WCS936 TaxID=2823685 RepID=UPI0020B6FBE3|nr:amino acid permease [Streptomyces sp. AC602_WCS936]